MPVHRPVLPRMSAVWPTFAAWMLSSSIACGSTSAVPPEPTSHPDARTPPARRLQARDPIGRVDGSGDRPLDSARARRESRAILAEVAQARALAVRGPLRVEVIDKDGIRNFAKDTLYEHITPQEFHLLARIETSFGVLPVGSDPERVVLDLLEQGVLGLYDPKKEVLFIGDFVPRSMLSMVVGHEIVHGLQDMHFDLEALQQPIRHDSDAESARTFLVEGDAQAAYLAWVSGDLGLDAIGDDVLRAMGDQAIGLAGVANPYPILTRQLQLPYADGTATIIQLVKRKGWQAVDALYADLPRTSEQMLHVDKLIEKEPALEVTIDPTPLLEVFPDRFVVYHDTLGEAALLSWLAEVDGTSQARAAAAGWGGGRYLVLDRKDSPSDTPIVAGMLAWDTAADAGEFEPSFRRYLQKQIGSGFVVQRNGREVVFAVRLPADAATKDVTSALLRATKIAAKSEGKRS